MGLRVFTRGRLPTHRVAHSPFAPHSCRAAESRDVREPWLLNGVGRVLIEVVPYDGRWPVEFERLRGVLLQALSGSDVSVEHVGSTAIPGLIAKPILDVDVNYGGETTFVEVRSKLEAVGYDHRGDQGVPGREAFRQDGSDVPRSLEAQPRSRHHLYVCHEDSTEVRRHLAFRDALRADPSLAGQYAELKEKLLQLVGDDRERYTEGKSEFVEGVLSESAL